jgi:hypothetical protein
MKFGASALLFVVSAAWAQTGASVEGTVTNKSTHAGVAGVGVTLWTQKGVRYSAITTDSSGGFSIPDVAPGDYDLRFDKPGYVQLELPTFGQPRLHVGMSGTVRADVEMSAMATLRGRVLDPEGKPAPKITVELGPFVTDDTDAEGRFEFQDVHPGTYFLRAVADVDADKDPKKEQAKGQPQIVTTWYPSTANPAEAEHIVVRGGADLAGYEIKLKTASVYHVRGVVLDEMGKPVANADVMLLGPPGDPVLFAGRIMHGNVSSQYFLNLRGPGATGAQALTHEDGAFELSGVRAGDWSLFARSNAFHDSHNDTYFDSSRIVPAPVSDHDVDNVELRFEPSFDVTVKADWGDQPAPGNPKPSVMLFSVNGTGVLMQSHPAGGDIVYPYIAPGRYRILPLPGVAPGYYASAIMLAGQDVLNQEVELTAATTITIVYKRNPGSIRGTVDQGEGAMVVLWPQGPSIPPFVRAVQAGAHGSFEFTNVEPGDYSLVAFDQIPASGGSPSFVMGAVSAGTRVSLQEGGSESVQLTVTNWPE